MVKELWSAMVWECQILGYCSFMRLVVLPHKPGLVARLLPTPTTQESK